MSNRAQWLFDLDAMSVSQTVDGLVPVNGYKDAGLAPEAIAIMEKARAYSAHYVFFEASRNGRPPVAQAFVFISGGPPVKQSSVNSIDVFGAGAACPCYIERRLV